MVKEFLLRFSLDINMVNICDIILPTPATVSMTTTAETGLFQTFSTVRKQHVINYNVSSNQKMIISAIGKILVGLPFLDTMDIFKKATTMAHYSDHIMNFYHTNDYKVDMHKLIQ